MTHSKYDSPEHRALRAKYEERVASGQAWCAETVCLEERDGRSRWIRPGTKWHVAHHDDGVTYKGPAHERCNAADGARRGNAMRTKPRRRRAL